MSDEENPTHSADEGAPKNVGRRRLLGMLTAGGGLAAAGLVPGAWVAPVADVLNPSLAGAQVAPSPTPTTSVSPTPSVSVSLSSTPPTPTPTALPAEAVRDTPDFTG
jgi:hypothetical protein